ncbi:MAG: hypothetical protein NTX96_03540 [Candidatus Zambryskibacteria bacterium]|nr:hypothetical protein [Candidatus Zambryskibacteria bacterium]
MVSQKTQKILIAMIVLLLLGFLGYKMFTKETVVLENTIVPSNTEIVGQDILSLVEELKAISIDQDFFSNPLFSNLKDFTQTIFPEARGRVNPFAVIGSDGSLSLPQATSTGGR